MIGITAIKRGLHRGGAMLLTLTLCMQFGMAAVFATDTAAAAGDTTTPAVSTATDTTTPAVSAAADTTTPTASAAAVTANTTTSSSKATDGTVEIWEWTLVTSQPIIPSDQESHPVLLLYQQGDKTYMVDGSKHTSGKYLTFTPVEITDGMSYNSKSIRTKENISNMTIRYTGETDSDNGGAKICEFGITENGETKTLSVDGDGFYIPSTENDNQKITVLMTNMNKDADVKWDHVMLFHNVWMWGDLVVKFNSSGVYAERDTGWDLGQFKMYIGSKVKLSAITHDYTISSGGVANFNDYVYIPQGVTITIEKGGVLSVSGILYNNGTIINNGGDIVVQKGATIEQFCLNDDYGGSIRCNGGDLVILKNGRVSTGTTDDIENSYGSGFILENGATCTNFGVLVVGSNSRVTSGATLDNRESAIMFFGYKIKSENSGNLHSLSKTAAASKDSYEGTSIYDSQKNTCTRADLLYVGSDVMLYNQGTVWLELWTDQLSGAGNITCKGSGIIKSADSNVLWTKFGWSMPDMWYTMWRPYS